MTKTFNGHQAFGFDGQGFRSWIGVDIQSRGCGFSDSDMARLGSVWNMEDRVQEVIMNLWRSFNGFEGRSSEKTWVWRVATNTMLMLRRKDDRTPHTESIETERVDKLDDEAGNDNQRQLQQLIDALPEESSVVIRAFLDGFSYM